MEKNHKTESHLTLPAMTGWRWIEQGWALFKQRPYEMLILFLVYLFVTLLIGWVPILGNAATLMSTPLFTMGFMHACAMIEKKIPITPNTLLVAFQSPALKNLLILGTLYLLTAFLLVLMGYWWVDKTVVQTMTNTTLKLASIPQPLFLISLFTLVLTPLMMAFWYAAPLIMWKKMSTGKALFYSFFTVKRQTKAFLVYGLAWVMLGVILPLVLGLIMAVLGLIQQMPFMIIMLLLFMLLTVIMYCSFYPSYVSVFGRPDAVKDDGV